MAFAHKYKHICIRKTAETDGYEGTDSYPEDFLQE